MDGNLIAGPHLVTYYPILLTQYYKLCETLFRFIYQVSMSSSVSVFAISPFLFNTIIERNIPTHVKVLTVKGFY